MAANGEVTPIQAGLILSGDSSVWALRWDAKLGKFVFLSNVKCNDSNGNFWFNLIEVAKLSNAAKSTKAYFGVTIS
ncbi:hypothetical protein NQ315_009411 [Exocentrus adspersus]|uniref:Uncharacterized protein n=1 Tax=Exocentrus adspersus TaxID=1586481 RepID=A0AAV8WII5_9CUCU|nr:hypothetical protein NQ315_009411 [Exocentrus adspersus]